ncbi:MAG TPA: type IV secretory system conjugative DNA transfer family protein, partial [Acidimicrobiales bacterium]|nr:type IV secretory system conjugative DNA transfer family protein [Acidimicrobiales bacterium]
MGAVARRAAMTSRPVRRPAPGGTSGAVSALVGVAVAWYALVWVDGELAGWLWRGHWPGATLTAVAVAAARLPAHMGDPAAAWPAAVRGDLPAAPAMYLTGGLTVLALAALGLGAARMGRLVGGGHLRRGVLSPDRRLPSSPTRQAAPGRWRRRPGARWATRGDLRSLRVGHARDGRLAIGRAGRLLVGTEARHSLLVVGPTQSGKTSGLAVPAILEWEGPVVATSVKGDLASVTRQWRARRGRCWVFDPTATAGAGPPAPWSPLAEAATWSTAQRMATWMVEATPARTGMTDGAFWYSAAAKLLAPLLLAASVGGCTTADLVRWNNTGDFDEASVLLRDAGESAAATALWASAERDERIRSSVATTLETVLSPFEDPVVARSTAASVIDPQSLVRHGGTLYLCGPAFEQARLAGLFAALVSAVVAAVVEEVNRTGHPLDPPLLLVLDEAANVAPIRDLDTLASTGAGMGMQLVTICQDLSQFTARYGEDRARTIANNHRAKLVLSG